MLILGGIKDLLTRLCFCVVFPLMYQCISSRAEAYQSIIMLMGSQQLYTRWRGKAKVNHMTHPEWTNETASQLLEAWKREFTKVRRHKNLSAANILKCVEA